MDLVGEIKRHISAYLDGTYSTDDLQYELASFDQSATDQARAGDKRAERLLGLVAGLLAEYSAGHRSDSSVKIELANEVAPPVATASFGSDLRQAHPTPA